MNIIDITLQKAKKLHVSITEAAKVAGVSRRNIYGAKCHGRVEIESMLPAERKHLMAIQDMCKKVERENKKIMSWK